MINFKLSLKVVLPKSSLLLFLFGLILIHSPITVSQAKTERVHATYFEENPQETGLVSIERYLKEESSLISLEEEAEEDLSINSRMLAYTTPPIGQMLGSISLNSYSLVLSQDAKTAFVSIAEKGWVQVINVSNLESPKLLATLKLNDSKRKVLALSPDGKILFASNFLSLEVIDVSNRESPKLLGSYVHDLKPGYVASKASLAVSKDGKTVFAASYGFQIFDVSNPSKIELISSEINPLKLSAVAMHQDGKTLFFGSKSLKIYDASDPRSLKLLCDFPTKGSIHSILLSHDSKTLFSVGAWGKTLIHGREYDTAIVESINVSQLTNPEILNTYPEMTFLTDPHYLLGITPDEQFLFIKNIAPDNKLRILNLKTSQFVEDIHKDLLRISSMAFLPYKNTFIATNELRFFAFKLYSDIRNSVILSPQGNFLTMSNLAKFECLAWSSDILFTVMSLSGQLFLFILDTSNPSSLRAISSTDLPSAICRDMSLSSDKNLAYINTESNILVYDVSDLTNPARLGSFLDYGAWKFAISRDDKTAFIFESTEQFHGLKIYDIKKLNSAELLSTTPIIRQKERMSVKVCFSKDRKAGFFVTASSLLVYDLSVPTNPVLATKTQLSEDGSEMYVTSVTLSSDDKLLFVLLRETNVEKIKIYDVTALASPKLLSFLNVPDKYEDEYLVVSPDNKFIYLTSSGELNKLGLITIDISDPSSPFLVGFTKMFTLAGKAKISDDGKRFISTENTFLIQLSLLPKFTLYIPIERFSLGHTKSTNVAVLQLNSEGIYIPMNENYKILKISLYESEVLPSEKNLTETYPTLPNWMSFDFENSILTVEPKWSNHLGVYHIYGTLSKGLSLESFNELLIIKSEADKQDLIATLIAQGYLDSDYFLSSNFNPNGRLVLPAKYQEASIAIHKILSKYHFSTVTQIQVHPSLKVHKSSKPLLIETPSQNIISVAIQLKNPPQNVQAQFVTKTYSAIHSSFTDNKTVLILDGPLFEINKALENIFINLNDPNCSHNATMTISDGMNPSLTIDIPELAEYFKINEVPEMRLNLQDQIDKVPIITGEYFIIEIGPETFINPTEGQLEYELNGDIPEWLNQRGLTLTGTPPEELSPLNIDLVFVVKNQFKVLKVPFTIQVKISFLYSMKTAAIYGGYFLSLLGIFFSSSKVYNMFWKKFYRHPKIFFVEVDTGITPRTIYPIGFIAEEITESSFLMKKLEDLIKKESKGMRLVEYFTNNFHHKLNKELVIQKVEEVIQNLSVVQRKKNLKLYLPGINCRKEIILQLIFNEIIQGQINSNKEVFTKIIFEKIKHKWTKFLEIESLTKFVVNRAKLFTELSNFGIDTERFGSKNSHNDSDDYSLEGRRLLSNNDEVLNLSLLEDALIDYGFRFQNFDRHLKHIRIRHKQKFKTASTTPHKILNFFSFNLWQLEFADEGMIGYGIGYKIVDNTLTFTGVPHRNFDRKTILVQVINSRGRILREILIKGALKQGEEKSEVNSSLWDEEKAIL